MAEAEPQTVIRRKTEAGRPTQDGTAMTPARALGQALCRTAQDQMALPARIGKLVERRMTLADLPEALEERALLALLDGPGEGIGLLAMAPSLLAGLIEMQTMGRLAAVAPPGRRPTRTDAAMTIDFIDGVLAGFEQALAELEAVTWAGGFRYASYLDDPRPLGLLLEDAGYRVFEADLELGLGTPRTGRIVLALPAKGRGQPPRRAAGLLAEAPAPPAGSAADAEFWQDQLQRTVLQAPVTLEAVLHRITLPLAAVLTFKPGMTLPVPLAALEDLRLEGLGGRRVGRGRLGQHQGFRAMRICGEAEAEPPTQVAPEPVAAAPPSRRAPKPAPPYEAAPMQVPEPILAPLPQALPRSLAALSGQQEEQEEQEDEPEPYAMVPMKIGSIF